MNDLSKDTQLTLTNKVVGMNYIDLSGSSSPT